MTINEIICKAMDGGYIPEGGIQKEWNPKIEKIQDCADLNISDCVLDPKFWIAVGKELDWTHSEIGQIGNYVEDWKIKMHQMIDHLIEGKSIEDFISTL